MPAVLGQDSRTSVLPRGPVGYPLRLAVLVALYDGAAQLSFHLEFAGPVAAIVWLPVGVGIAFVYLGGLALLPGVLIGDLLANDYGALPLGSALGQTGGNVLEVVRARACCSAGSCPARDAARDGWRPQRGCSSRSPPAPLVSATIGSRSLLLGGVIVWRTSADACGAPGGSAIASGALIVVPLALAWATAAARLAAASRLSRSLLLCWRSPRSAELALRATSAHLPGLPGAALGRAAVRRARRYARRRRRRRVRDLGDTPLRRARSPFQSITDSVLRHAALHRASSALSTLCLAAVVVGARALRRRLAASRARLVDAAATPSGAHRAQPARRRAAAADRACRAARARGRARPRRTRRIAAARLEAPASSWRSRSTSCASSPTASTRPSLSDLGLGRALRERRGALVDPGPSSLEIPAERVDPTRPRRPRTSWSRRRSRMPSKHARADVDPRPGRGVRSRSAAHRDRRRRWRRRRRGAGHRRTARPRRDRGREVRDREHFRPRDACGGADSRRRRHPFGDRRGPAKADRRGASLRSNRQAGWWCPPERRLRARSLEPAGPTGDAGTRSRHPAWAVERMTDWLSQLWDTLTSVSVPLLILGLAFQTAQTVLVALAWRNILRAAYPDGRRAGIGQDRSAITPAAMG